MNTKKPKLIIALLGISLFSAVVFTSCTDDGAKKEEVKTDAAPAAPAPDTSKMTAAPAMADSPKMAEPAKTDSPAKPAALKKVDKKPLGTKP